MELISRRASDARPTTRPPRRRPSRRSSAGGTVVPLALFVIATSLALTVAPARAQSNCDPASGTSSYINSVLTTDRGGPNGYVAFEQAIRATGKLYLCGLGSFYVAPSPLPPGPPGTVIRVAPLYPSPGGTSTWAMRVMYKTRNRLDQDVAATGIVITRREPPPVGDVRPVVVWDHGTAGIAASCVDYLDNFWLQPEVRSEITAPLLATYDAVIAATDYIGFGAAQPGKRYHTYMVAKDQAQATIDLVRAVGALSSATGAGTEWAVMGHSQGGQASISTAEHAASYGSGLDLKTAVGIGSAGKLAELVSTATGQNGLFTAAALLGFSQSYANLVPTQMLKTNQVFTGWLTGYRSVSSLVYDLFDNGSNAVTWYLAATGTVPAYTLDGPFQLADWTNRDQRTYTSSNITPSYTTPRGGKTIVGCDYNHIAKVYNWISSLAGGSVLQTSAFSSATGQALLNQVLPENSVGNVATTVPLGYVLGDCDDLGPMTTPKLPGCGGPAAPGGTAPPEFTLRPGYAWGPGWTNFADVLCAAGDHVTGAFYGEMDLNLDGLTETGFEENGNGLPDLHYGHSEVVPRAMPDILGFIADAWAGPVAGNCP